MVVYPRHRWQHVQVLEGEAELGVFGVSLSFLAVRRGRVRPGMVA